MPIGPMNRSMPASGARSTVGCLTSLMAKGRTTRRCGRTSCLAFRCRTRYLAEQHWAAVVDVVQRRLLTPVGLRSLAPGEPDYKPSYDGDLRSRDAAYHQGTVWAWLIGPFIDAWLRVHPDQQQQAREFLQGFKIHLSERRRRID